MIVSDTDSYTAFAVQRTCLLEFHNNLQILMGFEKHQHFSNRAAGNILGHNYAADRAVVNNFAAILPSEAADDIPYYKANNKGYTVQQNYYNSALAAASNNIGHSSPYKMDQCKYFDLNGRMAADGSLFSLLGQTWANILPIQKI